VTDERPRPDRRWIRQVGTLSTVGLTLVISTVLGLWGGHLLDGWLGTDPWLKLVGLLLGIAAGFVNLIRVMIALERGDDGERGH
jgi:F0F1-type ATP synthase assembly protein I